MHTQKFAFASDNTAGMCPEALAAIQEANEGYHPSYGDDPITSVAAEAFRTLFETDCDVYFVFTGTAANSLALASLCQSYHSVITHESAHIETDECGAPEFFSNGTKLLTTSGSLGKLNPVEIRKAVTRRSDIHYPKPRVISLSCPTELGTVYTPQELADIGSVAKEFGLKVHMDGARFSHAIASLNLPPKELTWKVGIDVLSFGGTKLGMPFGEAVVFFDRALGTEFAYRCKQAGQLASKMRFLAAPWIRLFKDDLWKTMASRANARATQLRVGLEKIPGVRLLYPTEANAVFAELPEAVHFHLKARGWRYYVFIGGGARFMCSWKTSKSDVDALLADISSIAR